MAFAVLALIILAGVIKSDKPQLPDVEVLAKA